MSVANHDNKIKHSYHALVPSTYSVIRLSSVCLSVPCQISKTRWDRSKILSCL